MRNEKIHRQIFAVSKLVDFFSNSRCHHIRVVVVVVLNCKVIVVLFCIYRLVVGVAVINVQNKLLVRDKCLL